MIRYVPDFQNKLRIVMDEFFFIFVVILGVIAFVVPNPTLSTNIHGADILRKKRDNIVDDAKLVALGAIGTFLDVAQQGVHLEDAKSLEFFGAKAETGHKFDVGAKSAPSDDDSEERRRRRSLQRVRRSPCKRYKMTTSVPATEDGENSNLKLRNKRQALYDDDPNDNGMEKEVKEESENILKSIGNIFRRAFNNILDWFKGNNNGAVENIK